MHMIIDGPMMEVCGNDGAVYIASGSGKKGKVSDAKAFAAAVAAELVSLEGHELEPIWNRREQQ